MTEDQNTCPTTPTEPVKPVDPAPVDPPLDPSRAGVDKDDGHRPPEWTPTEAKPRPPIAEPAGLFQGGPTGASGDLIPMVRIRRDIFQRIKMHYGLNLLGNYQGVRAESMLIDIIQDGYEMHDPHSARPMSFSTDDPEQRDRGTWFNWYDAPNAGERFSALGTHTVIIKVAPRVAPAAGTTGATEKLPERDFSPEAGGVVRTFQFEIYPTSESVFSSGRPPIDE